MKHTSLITLGTLVALSTSTHAVLLYSDTFSRVTGSGDGNGDPNGAADNFSDWGTNDNGLGGTTTQAWVTGPTRAGGGRNAVTNGSLGISHGTSSLFGFDATTVAPLGFTVSLDFSRFVVTPDPGPGGGGFIAFGLGVDASTTAGALNDFTAIGASDFALLFQQAANGNSANTSVFEDNTSLGNFDYLAPDTPHSLLVTVVPAAAGAYGDADTVNINVLVDGAISQDYSVGGGDDFGTFTVSANNFDTRFIDNLVVESIPEPGSTALFGIGALVIGLRRSRNRS